MNKETFKRLTTYKAKIQDMMSAPIPEKHKGHPETYKAYLQKELDFVNILIEKARGLA